MIHSPPESESYDDAGAKDIRADKLGSASSQLSGIILRPNGAWRLQMKQWAWTLLLVMLPAVVHAQMGVTNPTTPTSNPPFGTLPNPLNNPFPTQPWSQPGGMMGTVVREVNVPPQTIAVPMEVPQPGSLPNRIETVTVTIPGYRIVETSMGYWVDSRHTLVQGSNGAYYWQGVTGGFISK